MKKKLTKNNITGITLVLIAIDQIVKIMAPDFNFIIINNILSFRFVENHGISFGLLSNSKILIIIISFILIGVIISILIKEESNVGKFGATMLLAGAIGNLIDRIFLGYVVDYIDIELFIFNIADIYIFVGALIILYVYFVKEKYEN